MWSRRAFGGLCPGILARVAPAARTDGELATRLAAIASLGAAVIHFAVAPTHWQDWIPSGLFFVSLAVLQLVWARTILIRPTTLVTLAGIAISAGAIALWIVSRTAGAPFGPNAGVPEAVQAADLCALLLQIYVVMGAGWAWHRGRYGEPVPAFANAIILLGAAAVMVLASTVGVASGLRHGDHHGPASAEGGHHQPTPQQADHHHSTPETATIPPVAESIGPAAPAPATPSGPVLDGARGDHHHEQ